MEAVRLIDSFFNAYEKRVNEALNQRPDVNAQVEAFADCCVEANPHGVKCFKNDKDLITDTGKLYQFYLSLGTQEMKIVSSQTMPIDGLHFLVRTTWRCRYLKKDDSEVNIDVEIVYLLQIRDGHPKIFAYIAGDEEAVYKEHGIEPYK